MINLLVYRLYSKREFEFKTNKEVNYLISEKVRNEFLDLEFFSKSRFATWLEVKRQVLEDLKD